MVHLFSKKNKVLLAELVRTDFKLRYEGSVLGYAWSLLRPLLIFLILYVVFVYFLKIGVGIPHYAIYLLLGIVLWNFFVETSSQSLSSIVARGDLIRKIRIPRWIIVLSSSVSALINLGLNLIIVFVLMAFNHVGLMPSSLLLPLVIIEIYIFALGISLFLAAAYVKYRDIKYIWEVIIQAGFYATPIIYPLSKIPNLKFQKLLFLNPMTEAIQAARYLLVSHATTTAHSLFKGSPYIYVPFVIIIITTITGVVHFRKESKYFAENI